LAGEARLGLLERGWRSIRSAGARRLTVTGVTLLAALAIARFSWAIPWPAAADPGNLKALSTVQMPVLGPAEQALYDFRSTLFADSVKEQDPRILLVVYNDQTLINARKRSPLDRGLLAKALRNLDTMGAKAIGIDILFDQPQDEDDQLVDTLRAMKTPISVGYAETGVNAADIGYEQQRYLDAFLARLKGSNARPASIALDDSYGVTRVWPKIFPQLPALLGRTMLASAGEGARTLPGYEGAIRYQRAGLEGQSLFTEIAIDNFADPSLAPAMAPVVANRYVLIGGDIVDVDRVATSLTGPTGEMVPGIDVHAQMIAQMLDGARLPHPSPWFLWAQALIVVIAATLSGLLEMRSWTFLPLVAAQFVVFVGLSFWLQSHGVDTYGLPVLGPALAWIIAFAAIVSAARASGAVQRRFAHSALGKYLPRSIAQEIIDRPELLALHGEKKEIFVLFSDLEGFTKMSHALEPEMVATLLNRYLEMLSQVVLDHGGVIDKFVGDAVVAFWGAPIARPDDGTRAAEAAYAMWQAGEEFRGSVDPGLPPVGRTRVGMHFGEAVVGNFGGASRIQYTALGDSMNTAARLEAANKSLETRVLASREFVERSGLDWWRPMGRVVLRGRRRPVDVYEAAPEFPDADRRELEKALELLEGDAAAGVALLAEIVNRNPDDRPLKNLLDRCRELNEEGAYVLG
jgi:adenylate cyclase